MRACWFMTTFQNPLGALMPDEARKGLVYRIGWVAAGRFARSVGRRKVMSSLSTNVPAQYAIAQYLRQGGYDRHLAAQLRPPVEPGQRTGDKGPRRHRAIIDAAPEERLRLSSSG